jgi:serine/threonine protein kinase
MQEQQIQPLAAYQTIACINEEHRVYLVQHCENRKIYVKKILDVYNADVYRFLQEHPIPGTPRLYLVWEEGQELTIIEEYINGTSLQEMIDRGNLSSEETASYLCDLCDILDRLHGLQQPIVHRDIKPSTVMITSFGNVVLLDFNAAKFLSPQTASDTVLLGTQGYAAPEQYGFGSSTPRTDIYALGILLKEMAGSMTADPKIFASVIARCTQMDPGNRFASVQEVKDAVMQAVHPERVSSSPSVKQKSTSYTLPGFRSKHPLKMITAVAGYLLCFWLCLTIELDATNTIQLWIERIGCLAMAFSIIVSVNNYRDIWDAMPLCSSSHRGVRYLGVACLCFVFLAIIFMIMMILVLIFE